jgi:hypothetical protein
MPILQRYHIFRRYASVFLFFFDIFFKQKGREEKYKYTLIKRKQMIFNNLFSGQRKKQCSDFPAKTACFDV